MTDSAFVFFVVKAAMPFAAVVPLAGEIVECPVPCASVTLFPLTGLLFASRSVTVIVEVAVPSAVTEAGFALTVETVALTAPAVKVTWAVWVIDTESVVSVAV